MSERARVAAIARILGADAEAVSIGIGDDAAALKGRPGAELVCSVDAQVEGVHFRRVWMSLEDVGYRAVMAAASDLAAMGAEPCAALSAWVLPPSVSDADVERLARGTREAADALAMPVVGGNLARGAELSLTTTVLGWAARPLTRGGARVGDLVVVTGSLGLAAAGLEALARGASEALRLVSAARAFRRPVARVSAVAEVASELRSAIDVSDGLVVDLDALAHASGVAVVLEHAALVSYGGRALADASAELDVEPLELLLYGGEDYAVVATAERPVRGFAVIGRVVEGAGVYLERRGVREPLVARGFDHFAPPK